MAPKTKPTDLPKAAKEYKDMLEALGGVTPTAVKVSCSKGRNKVFHVVAVDVTCLLQDPRVATTGKYHIRSTTTQHNQKHDQHAYEYC